MTELRPDRETRGLQMGGGGRWVAGGPAYRKLLSVSVKGDRHIYCQQQ